jgi:four helix bundle protein
VAQGSLAELETLLIVAERLNYIHADQLSDAEQAIADVAKPLHGLISRIRP